MGAVFIGLMRTLAILRNYKDVERRLANIRALCARRSATLRPGSQTIDRGLTADVKALGDCVGSLLPPEQTSLLRESLKDTVHIEGTRFRLPFELARLDSQFLSARHMVRRRFGGIVPPNRELRPVHRALYISDPSGSLPYESVEAVFFSEIIRPRHDMELDMPRRMRCSEFVAALSSGSYDLIHFTGHGRYEPETGRSKLLFADGEISPHEIRAAPDGQPPVMVVLNACSTAKDTSLTLARSGPVQTLVEAFLQRGVGAVIGTLWPIGDCSAAKFSTAFYRLFFDCQVHASNALMLTKRRYAVVDDTVDVMGYVFYGLDDRDPQTLRKEWAVDRSPDIPIRSRESKAGRWRRRDSKTK